MKRICIILLIIITLTSSVAAMDIWEQAWLEARIYDDIEIFPVIGDIEDTAFEDSWEQPRSYGGEREHYGTDIMDAQNLPHRLAIRSMTEGTITKLGWNELGGWRVGITSPNGIYYYYAHLASYREDLQVGMLIHAGELLGWMGDSGYGAEGTTGMFPVHLHVGILNDPTGEGDDWVNPYPFLVEVFWES